MGAYTAEVHCRQVFRRQDLGKQGQRREASQRRPQIKLLEPPLRWLEPSRLSTSQQTILGHLEGTQQIKGLEIPAAARNAGAPGLDLETWETTEPQNPFLGRRYPRAGAPSSRRSCFCR